MALGTTWNVLRRITGNPANRGHRLRPLMRFIGWQVYKRLTGRSLDIRVFSTMFLRCYPDSAAASASLYAREGISDFHEMSFMRHFLREGDGFIDVGANVGVYTLLAASLVGRSGRIAAFEASPQASRRLHENIRLNRLDGVVDAFALALSDRNGTTHLTVGRDCTNQLVTKEVEAAASEEVECRRIDDLIKSTESFALGKLDVEGAEPLVLRGAERMLARANPPVWLLELNGRLRNFGYTEVELEEWLAARGYRFALYDGFSRRLEPTPSAWNHASNVLAIHRDRLAWVRARIASETRDL